MLARVQPVPKLAANLSMLFTEVPFLERFAAAREAGFGAVEVQLPYEQPPGLIREQLDRHHQRMLLFNLPSGDWTAGDRGIAADPHRVDEFRAGVERALAYASVLGVTRLNCLAGTAPRDATDEALWRTLEENVRFAAERLDAARLELVVEPINRFDVPGFLLSSTRDALRLLDQVGRPNVSLLFDVYHVQRAEGNLTPTLREHIGRVGHVQIADNPGRHQPGTGEINYPFLFSELDRLGYAGYVSLEYIPTPSTAESLGWIQPSGATLD